MRVALAAPLVALALAGAAHAPVVRAITPRPDATQGMAAPAPAMPEATAPVAPILRPLAPWLPLIRRTSAAQGLPWRMTAAIVLVESGGNAAAVSPAGAIGLAQVEPATAHALGFWGVANPTVNLEAATAYLARLSDRYGVTGACWAQGPYGAKGCAERTARVLSAYAGGPGSWLPWYTARVEGDWRVIAA